MSTPVQYPTNQLAIGGQPTVPGYVVTSAVYGYAKDEEDRPNSNGTHKVKIQYSKRKTLSLTLEAEYGTNISTIVDGDEMTVDDVLYNIVSAVPTKTRGPTILQVELIQQAEGLA